MGAKVYKHDIEIFNPDTGEMTYDTKYSVTAVNNEEDYIKVYRYLNTVFAFKGINQSFVPCLMEIANYMSFADKGQEVVLTERYRKQIADALNISVKRVNDIITGLKKADVLRPIINPESGKPYRSTFAVNPFIIGRGKWSDIKELRAQFDYNSGLITTQSVVTDKITGKTMAKITQEIKKKKKQMPSQTPRSDKKDKTAAESERYSLEQIRQFFDYDTIIHDHPSRQQDIDAVMDILHTTMNTDKTIRVAGQDKPCMTVIGKLMKLNKESIMYAIEQFSAQTERIQNPASYMLTILYQAPEQCHLDAINQAAHDMAESDPDKKNNRMDAKSKNAQNNFTNFPQRKYDYDELERELLGY